jgi:hypothetical protein
MAKYGNVFINNSKKTIRVHYYSPRGVYYTPKKLMEGLKPEVRKAVEEAMKKGYEWK